MGIKELLINNSRKAIFKTVLCYIDNSGLKTYTGTAKGKISLERADELDKSLFNHYSFIFIPDGFDKTRSELSTNELKKISHRMKAFNSLDEELIKV